MDVLFQRARSFASEAAKRSQDLAKEAAKISHEIALETAKRSKEIASEASKKADALKALAGEISPAISSSSPALPSSFSSASGASNVPSEEELHSYGITAELREFVNGLTISTFQDFPSQELDAMESSYDVGTSNTRQDLTQWQEQHALLVLKAVPEISQFRYSLCPRVMKERRFWTIYFTLVKSHIAPYEASAVEKDAPVSKVSKEPIEELPMGISDTSEVIPLVTQNLTTTVAVIEPMQSTPVTKAVQKSRSFDDTDLDAYLLGDRDSDSDDGEGDGFDDTNFDDLVNGTDSDSEGEKALGVSRPAGPATSASDASSDGELVCFPSDLDNQTTTEDDGL